MGGESGGWGDGDNDDDDDDDVGDDEENGDNDGLYLWAEMGCKTSNYHHRT